MKNYEPELGQMAFGNPWNQYECPELVIAGLEYLADEICRVMGNNTQEDFDPPTGNYGTKFKNDTFEMRSYYWGEDEQEIARPNFKFKGFEVRWYKHARRGTSCNMKISAEEFANILHECLKSVREMEEK